MQAVVNLSQLAGSDAERSNRRITGLLHIIPDVMCVRHTWITCLLHIISDLCVRHTRGTTLIFRAFNACAAAVQTSVLVRFGPSCLGHYKPLQLLHAHCLGLLLSVCVCKNYEFIQAKVYRVLAVNGLPTPH